MWRMLNVSVSLVEEVRKQFEVREHTKEEEGREMVRETVRLRKGCEGMRGLMSGQ